MDEGEFSLIREIRKIAGRAGPPVMLGIGDDCAAISHGRGGISLHTTDCLVEGIHFRRGGRTPGDVGWKAEAVNLSDIASMGGRPIAFMLTLVIPRGERKRFVLAVVRGAVACGRRFGARLMGGNISSNAADGLIVDISMIGTVSRGGMLRRDGARPGDTIFVAGWPGRSRAGLTILESEDRILAGRFAGLVKAHLRPEPMLRAGATVAGRGVASSMIDTSDGLVQDLGHICESSGAGAELDPDRVPLHKELIRYCGETGEDALELALSGGEDYGLVFTSGPRHASRVEAMQKELGVKVTAVGRIVKGRGVKILGLRGPAYGGFDHLNPPEPAPRRP